MIKRLQLQNFKSHVATDLQLRPFTVLVGPSGSGKTAILDALMLSTSLSESRHAREDHFAWCPSAYCTTCLEQARREDGTSARLIRITCSGADVGVGPWVDEVTCRSAEKHWHVQALTICREMGAYAFNLTPDDPAHFEELVRPRVPVRDLRDGRPVHTPSTDWLARRLEINLSRAKFLGLDHLGYASVENVPNCVRDDLNSVFPDVSALETRPPIFGASTSWIDRAYARRSGGDSRPLKVLGSGVARAAHVLAAARSLTDLLLIDGLERDLHPLAQARLTRRLAEIVRERAGTLQIITTTTSPYVLDEVQIDGIRVLALDPDGVSRVRPLGAHPSAKVSPETLRPGELWSLDAEEDWIFKDDQDSEEEQE